MRVVGTIESTRMLAAAVAGLRPDTLVIEGDASEVTCLMGEFHMPRVIAVTLDSSTIDVFDRAHISRAARASTQSR
jgi:hypothetical protein